MGSLFWKAADYLMQNIWVLLDAPLVFVAVLVIAGVAAFMAASWLNGMRYQGILDQKTGTIENLKAQIDSLQERLKDVQSQLTRPAPPLVNARDPDGVYQFGAQVGVVQFPQVDDANGIVRFASIIGAAKPNRDRDIEYRDLILHIKTINTEGTTTLAGQVQRQLGQVACEIIGRSKQ